jgi:hypothetical protein
MLAQHKTFYEVYAVNNSSVYMSPDLVFSIANNFTLLPWLLLLILPRWRGTRIVAQSGGAMLLFAGGYIIMLATSFSTNTGSAPNFSTLEGIKTLFQNDYALVAGWLHYLAFDLFVGCWQVEDAHRRGIKHYWLIPSLFFTLMLGPVGWLLYQIVRAVHAKRMVTEQF